MRNDDKTRLAGGGTILSNVPTLSLALLGYSNSNKDVG